MRYKITTAPTIEPVSLAEAKLWLKVDGDDDDDLIGSLITAATDYCQQYEGRAYIEQTITAFINTFAKVVNLPMSPVLSITSVHYLDVDGNWELLDDAFYNLHNTTDPAYIEFDISDISVGVKDCDNAVRIIFTSGYRYHDGAAWAGDVPERVKAAMCLLITHWYERRMATCEQALKEIPMGVKSLLSERLWNSAD